MILYSFSFSLQSFYFFLRLLRDVQNKRFQHMSEMETRYLIRSLSTGLEMLMIK